MSWRDKNQPLNGSSCWHAYGCLNKFMGRKWGQGNHYRHLHIMRILKACDPEFNRLKRSYRQQPHPQDDVYTRHQRSWKKFRRTRWKPN
jgi:hypothetical protein